MSHVRSPHFAFPFRFIFDGSSKAAEVQEQDSPEEIADCVEVVIRTPLGTREDLPRFGITQQEFSTPGVNSELLRSEILYGEPRAELILTEREPFDIDGIMTDIEEVRIGGGDSA